MSSRPNAFPLRSPRAIPFCLQIRGLAPRNAFEFKLIDESHQNVWRYRVEAFDFPETWQPLIIRSHQIGFAWGQLGGGPPRDVTAIELVIAAGPGGKGTVWIEALKIRDETYRLTPNVQASSALPGHGPENALSGGNMNWRSEASHDAPVAFDRFPAGAGIRGTGGSVGKGLCGTGV